MPEFLKEKFRNFLFVRVHFLEYSGRVLFQPPDCSAGYLPQLSYFSVLMADQRNSHDA